MPTVTHGPNAQQAALWKTQTWRPDLARPAWSAEQRRIAALPLDEMLAIEPETMDDWQRCLVAERFIGTRRTDDALRVLASVGATGTWHPAVSYLDVFEALAEMWRQAGAPDSRVEVRERAVSYARSRDPANVRMCCLDLAEAICDAGRVDEALGIFAEQVGTEPLDPWPYWFMGVALTATGHAAWADAALRRGLEVLRAIGDPEHLAGQFQEHLRHTAAALPEGGEPSLPDALATLFAKPLPHVPAGGHRAPAPRPAPAAGHRRVAKVGRNDPCPCGSGKKFKRCCGA